MVCWVKTKGSTEGCDWPECKCRCVRFVVLGTPILFRMYYFPSFSLICRNMSDCERSIKGLKATIYGLLGENQGWHAGSYWPKLQGICVRFVVLGTPSLFRMYYLPSFSLICRNMSDCERSIKGLKATIYGLLGGNQGWHAGFLLAKITGHLRAICGIGNADPI